MTFSLRNNALIILGKIIPYGNILLVSNFHSMLLGFFQDFQSNALLGVATVACFCTFAKFWFSIFTWLPKTPIAQAEETWFEGNHVAASWGGMPRMKICEIATIVCPANRNGK